MKITVDKEFTNGYEMAQVKEDIKEFKARYTDGDVLNAMRSQTDFWGGYGEDIIKAEAKAFPAGWDFQNKTLFAVEMLIDGYNEMYKIRFYIDMDLNVDTRKGFVRVTKYAQAM